MCAPERLCCVFASCSVVRQHPLAAFQSESQQCRMNGEEHRNIKKIEGNVGIGTRTVTDSDDDAAL